MIILKNLITEIGEASLPPFKYTQTSTKSQRREYTIDVTDDIQMLFILRGTDIVYGDFEADHDIDQEYSNTPVFDLLDNGITNEITVYEIIFSTTEATKTWLVQNEKGKKYFGFPYMESFLNVNQVLRLMSTIVHITKEDAIDTLKHMKYFFYKYTAVKNKSKSPNDERRKKLYDAFMKKNITSDFSIAQFQGDTYIYPKGIIDL